MAVIKRCLPLLCIIVVSRVDGEDAAPASILEFTERYCISSHDADKQKGDLRIDTLPWALTETEPRDQWELIHEYISYGDMPPEEAKRHPGTAARDDFLAELESAFFYPS